MPMKRHLYPKHWEEFSRFIRFDRAKNHCEFCNVPNGELIERGVLDGIPFYWLTSGETFNAETGESLGQIHSYDLEFSTKQPTKVVLTVAHLDNDNGICDCEIKTKLKCANPDHVKALCQRCHLLYDRDRHLKNRNQTFATRNDDKRGLFGELENENNNV
jgi:hypothetical protein